MVSLRSITFLLSVAALAAKWSGNVHIIRHGEKCVSKDCKAYVPGPSTYGLSSDGKRRAEYLKNCYPGSSGTLAIFYADGGKKATRERDLIMPLAKKLGIQPGKTPLTKGGPDNIACDIMGKKANSYASELSEDIQDVLIVWEHGCIPRLAKSLGASDHPNPWPSLCGSWKADRNNSESNAGCYDQIWTFKYGSNSVKTGSEGFMGDISRCNIRPNATESA
jgi:hypothetical protein